MKWDSFPCSFLKSLPIGINRLLQKCLVVFLITKRSQYVAKIVLCHRPQKRDTFSRPYPQRRSNGGMGFCQQNRGTLPFAKQSKRVPEVVLRSRPLERGLFSRPHCQSLLVRIH